MALEPVLELALVDQAGLKLTETHLPMPGLKVCATTARLLCNFILFIYGKSSGFVAQVSLRLT